MKDFIFKFKRPVRAWVAEHTVPLTYVAAMTTAAALITDRNQPASYTTTLRAMIATSLAIWGGHLLIAIAHAQCPSKRRRPDRTQFLERVEMSYRHCTPLLLGSAPVVVCVLTGWTLDWPVHLTVIIASILNIAATACVGYTRSRVLGCSGISALSAVVLYMIITASVILIKLVT